MGNFPRILTLKLWPKLKPIDNATKRARTMLFMLGPNKKPIVSIKEISLYFWDVLPMSGWLWWVHIQGPVGEKGKEEIRKEKVAVRDWNYESEFL